MKARKISIFGPVYWFWRESVDIKGLWAVLYVYQETTVFHLTNVLNIQCTKMY